MKTPLRYLLLPVLLLTLCFSVSARQGFAEDDDEDEITDREVKSFISEHLPVLGEDLKAALEDKDSEWESEILDDARYTIYEYRDLKEVSGDQVAAVFLSVTNMEEELSYLSYDYEDASDKREQGEIKKEIESILRKVLPAQLKLKKAELVALQKDIKQREDNPEAAFNEELSYYLGSSPSASSATAPSGSSSKVRTWTSKSGTKLEARLVKLTDGIAHLERADGKIFRVPVDKLSEKDQAWIDSQGDEDPFKE